MIIALINGWPLWLQFPAVLLLVGLVAAGFYWLMKWQSLGAWQQRIASLSPVLQTICGTLFVFSVTFLANSVWSTQDKASLAADEEARSLRIIRTYMDAMTGPSRDGMDKLLQDYGHALVLEWNQMVEHGSLPLAEQRLGDIYNAVLHGFSDGELNRTLQSRILDSLDTMSKARQERLTIAQETVTNEQWFTVIVLALLLLGVVAICHHHSAPARKLALTLITLAIAVPLFSVVTHDHPFEGYNAVNPHEILQAAGIPAGTT